MPSWCGVDLLRGWAFYMYRGDYFSGGYGLMPGGSALPEWQAVMEALASHPAAGPDDRPPLV